jgi:predicted ATPase
VAAVTAAIMAQLDGDRGKVSELAVDAVRAADEVTTRQWQQWAAVLQWWCGRAAAEPEVPGPLLRPYFLMLLADREGVSAERAFALLNEALDTVRATGERFCEAEVLRVRAGVRARGGDLDGAVTELQEAVAVARAQGASMLELRALTDWQRAAPSADVRRSLVSCLSAVGDAPALSVQRAAEVLAGP